MGPRGGRSKVETTRLPQVHCAWQQFGRTLIPVYSPEAHDRSERAVRTLRDRPKELARAGITDVSAAKVFRRDPFVPAGNQRGAVPAAEPRTALVPWVEASRTDMVCAPDDRVVANDNTVRWCLVSEVDGRTCASLISSGIEERTPGKQDDRQTR